MPQWIIAARPPTPATLIILLYFIVFKEYKFLGKFLKLISCYVYCLSPRKHLPNVNSMRRVGFAYVLADKFLEA